MATQPDQRYISAVDAHQAAAEWIANNISDPESRPLYLIQLLESAFIAGHQHALYPDK